MSEIFSAALLGSLIGTFFGGFTKFLWERWLPEWLTWRRTQRVDRQLQLSRVRAPAIRALSELHERLAVIARTQAADHRYVKAMGQGDYFVNSTAYLVARAFAWQEILRRRMSNYDYAQLYMRLEKLTEAFAHGKPGFQVFGLQQTEVGERMITGSDDDIDCMSYSDFLDRMSRDDPPRCLSMLYERVNVLLERPVDELGRVAGIDRALIEVLVFLDPRRRWRSLVASNPIDVTAIIQRWQVNGMLPPDGSGRSPAEAAEAAGQSDTAVTDGGGLHPPVDEPPTPPAR
jgi:hypothetical protein